MSNGEVSPESMAPPDALLGAEHLRLVDPYLVGSFCLDGFSNVVLRDTPQEYADRLPAYMSRDAENNLLGLAGGTIVNTGVAIYNGQALLGSDLNVGQHVVFGINSVLGIGLLTYGFVRDRKNEKNKPRLSFSNFDIEPGFKVVGGIMTDERKKILGPLYDDPSKNSFVIADMTTWGYQDPQKGFVITNKPGVQKLKKIMADMPGTVFFVPSDHNSGAQYDRQQPTVGDLLGTTKGLDPGYFDDQLKNRILNKIDLQSVDSLLWAGTFDAQNMAVRMAGWLQADDRIVNLLGDDGAFSDIPKARKVLLDAVHRHLQAGTLPERVRTREFDGINELTYAEQRTQPTLTITQDKPRTVRVMSGGFVTESKPLEQLIGCSVEDFRNENGELYIPEKRPTGLNDTQVKSLMLQLLDQVCDSRGLVDVPTEHLPTNADAYRNVVKINSIRLADKYIETPDLKISRKRARRMGALIGITIGSGIGILPHANQWLQAENQRTDSTGIESAHVGASIGDASKVDWRILSESSESQLFLSQTFDTLEGSSWVNAGKDQLVRVVSGEMQSDPELAILQGYIFPGETQVIPVPLEHNLRAFEARNLIDGTIVEGIEVKRSESTGAYFVTTSYPAEITIQFKPNPGSGAHLTAGDKEVDEQSLSEVYDRLAPLQYLSGNELQPFIEGLGPTEYFDAVVANNLTYAECDIASTAGATQLGLSVAIGYSDNGDTYLTGDEGHMVTVADVGGRTVVIDFTPKNLSDQELQKQQNASPVNLVDVYRNRQQELINKAKQYESTKLKKDIIKKAILIGFPVLLLAGGSLIRRRRAKRPDIIQLEESSQLDGYSIISGSEEKFKKAYEDLMWSRWSINGSTRRADIRSARTNNQIGNHPKKDPDVVTANMGYFEKRGGVTFPGTKKRS